MRLVCLKLVSSAGWLVYATAPFFLNISVVDMKQFHFSSATGAAVSEGTLLQELDISYTALLMDSVGLGVK